MKPVFTDIKPASTKKRTKRVVIIGNPNSGKTALFNRLTGLHHKIGNYPGVTVERKQGRLKSSRIIVEDMPGVYSLDTRSEDERIVSDMVRSWRNDDKRPDVIVLVIDATQLKRHSFLALQILDWGIPTIIVLNMIDVGRKNGFNLDSSLLKNRLNAEAVIPASAKTGEGIENIIKQIKDSVAKIRTSNDLPVFLSVDERLAPLSDLIETLNNYRDCLNFNPLIDGLRMVAQDTYLSELRHHFEEDSISYLEKLIQKTRETYHYIGIPYRTLEIQLRYEFIEQDILSLAQEGVEPPRSISERIDSVLTHPFAGLVIFIAVMTLIFNAIFSWAAYPMELIEQAVTWSGHQIDLIMPQSILKDLIVEGIVAGVGNVIIFLPQIVLLILFLGILEDSGYLARISFMLDGLMNRVGLQGKSVLPLLSGFACAIPAILAARTIENKRDRLLVIMLVPLMSCSARLPVYTLLIAAFIPQIQFWGFIQFQGLILLGMYLSGVFIALVIAYLIKTFKSAKTSSHFFMELPAYRIPLIRSLWWRVFDSAKLFMINAGSIILAMSVILWFLASYPRTDTQIQIENSYAGQLGKIIEPAIEPLGFDWKIGIGIISSFAAREVFVSTLATIYNIESDREDQSIQSLKVLLREDKDAENNQLYSPLIAVSLMVFFVFAAQCMSTFAIIRRETNSWKYPFMMLIYMNVLAYLASLIVFQGGVLLGLN